MYSTGRLKCTQLEETVHWKPNETANTSHENPFFNRPE
jgi:hypothetical protein